MHKDDLFSTVSELIYTKSGNVMIACAVKLEVTAPHTATRNGAPPFQLTP